MNNEMTLIPAEMKSRWENEAKTRTASWLGNMLELRELLSEYSGRRDGIIVQVYTEAAPCFGISAAALQNKMSILREYPAERLVYWMITKRLSLDAIRAVNDACRDGMIKDTPLEYINMLVDNGDGEGNVPTRAQVETLIAEQSGRGADYHVGVAITSFMRRMKIHESRAADFARELRELVARYSV